MQRAVARELMNIIPLVKLGEGRRRLGLTVDELALLAGTASATILEHEAGLALPDLILATAYQVVLGRPIAWLFPDLIDDVTADVAARAASLALDLRQQPHDQRRQRILRRLATITGEETIDYEL